MKLFDDTELWEILNTYDNTPNIATVKLDESLDDCPTPRLLSGREKHCGANPYPELLSG